MALLAGRRRRPAKLATQLCLAALLALALTGVAPSGAAARTEFEAAEYIAAISGEQVGAHELTLEGEVKVKCSHVTFSGELAERSEALTVTPSFSECTALGLAATVKANSCQYVLEGGKETAEHQLEGTTDVSCPTGQNIVVLADAEKCEAKIGTQTGLSAVTIHSENEATPANIKAEQKLSSIHYTVSKDEGACPFVGTGEKTNGSLTATSTFKASFESEAEGFAIGEVNVTQLCSAKPTKFFCPNGSGLPAGEVVKGTVPKPSLASVFLLEKGNLKPKNIVACQSNFTFKTKEALANPLPIENFSLEFPKGTCETLPNKTQCTVTMQNAPVTAVLNTSFLTEGRGYLQAAVTLKVECGTEIEQCEYKTGAYDIWLKGGNPAEFTTVEALPIPNVAGKKGCFDNLDLGGNYTVTAPKAGAIWVTS
jgi:hypothetical protein